MDTLTNGEIGCLKTFYEFFAGGVVVPVVKYLVEKIDDNLHL